ncbi:hypothetical protein [Flavobacterium sp. 3HN19-14]|uniref:hypothetical protein n=1 Tax=Flavobacterium sp. 3HN19-14 TaxID=3448133 RepID=UPI003EE2E234
MKNLKKFGFVAFAAMALVLSACSGSDDDGGSGSSLATYINAKVDGVQFKTTSFNGQSAGIATKQGSGDQQLIAISCTDASAVGDMEFNGMQVILIGQVAAGQTYQISPTSQSILAYTINTNGGGSNNNTEWDTDNCDGATGTVTVTSLSDTKIEGTFSFTGKKENDCSSQKVVTNGSFRGTFAN